VLTAWATLTIWTRDPLAGWAYSAGVFLLAAWLVFRSGSKHGQLDRPLWVTATTFALVLISLWSFLQLALGSTVYRYASWVSSLRIAAGAATCLSARLALRRSADRVQLLCGFAWFAFAVALVAVLAGYTSPGRVLWIWPSPYPDTWGPFLSRNDFAAFLELAFPVAFWAAQEPWRDRGPIWFPFPPRVPIWVPAWLLAAGFASASRAGSLLLLAEALALSGLFWKAAKHAPAGRRSPPKLALFVVFAALFVAVAGVTTLLGRFRDPEPFLYRDQIARSAIRMIRDRPWTGFGPGTFRHVYPAYATFDAGAVVEHVHNEFLEWATEGGVSFAMLWFALAAALVAPAWRARWPLGILAVFLHSLVDYPFAKFGVSAWTFVLLGTLQAEGERSSSPPALNLSKRKRQSREDDSRRQNL